MTLHTDVVAAFSEALPDFPVNLDRHDNEYGQKAFNVTILYSLNYDTVGGVHNLVGIIDNPAAYIKKYGEAFPITQMPKSVRRQHRLTK